MRGQSLVEAREVSHVSILSEAGEGILTTLPTEGFGQRSVGEQGSQGACEGLDIRGRNEQAGLAGPDDLGRPPALLATTAVPRIKASMATRPNGSAHREGTTWTQAVSRRCSSSSVRR